MTLSFIFMARAGRRSLVRLKRPLNAAQVVYFKGVAYERVEYNFCRVEENGGQVVDPCRWNIGKAQSVQSSCFDAGGESQGVFKFWKNLRFSKTVSEVRGLVFWQHAYFGVDKESQGAFKFYFCNTPIHETRIVASRRCDVLHLGLRISRL